MGKVVQLFGDDSPLFAECPKCGNTSWFVELDMDGEYETDLDFLLNMRSLICTKCKAGFEFDYGDLIIAEKEND